MSAAGSRLRDHRPRMDTSVCPNQEACARLYHGTLVSGLGPGDVCECCGVEIGNTPRVPSAREWRAAKVRTADDAAFLFNIHAPRPPCSDLEFVGWAIGHWDESRRLVLPGQPLRGAADYPPKSMRPVFAPITAEEDR